MRNISSGAVRALALVALLSVPSAATFVDSALAQNVTLTSMPQRPVGDNGPVTAVPVVRPNSGPAQIDITAQPLPQTGDARLSSTGATPPFGEQPAAGTAAGTAAAHVSLSARPLAQTDDAGLSSTGAPQPFGE